MTERVHVSKGSKTSNGKRTVHTNECHYVEKSTRMREWPIEHAREAIEEDYAEKCPECIRIDGHEEV